MTFFKQIIYVSVITSLDGVCFEPLSIYIFPIVILYYVINVL